MKKSRKIFGAVALSAVLAFGTAVPAFANNPKNLTSGDVSNENVANVNENNTTGTTTVNISTYSSHYDVTLPLVLPFMLDQRGGDGVAPTGYYIQNNGPDAAIEIENVTWEMNTAKNGTGANSLYTFGSGATLGSNTSKVTTNGVAPKYGSFTICAASADSTKPNASFETLAYLGTNTPSTSVGTPTLSTMKPVLGDTNATPATKDGGIYNYKEFTPGAWVIDKAANSTTPTRDSINLSISGTQLGGAGISVDEKTVESIASIVYTVGPKRTPSAA